MLIASSLLEAFNDSAAKGPQMMVGGTKSKAASQSGYFGTTFDRVLEVYTYMYLCTCTCTCKDLYLCIG